MSHSALGPQFAEHVESFRKKAAGTSTCGGARGLCERVSEHYIDHLYARGETAHERQFAGRHDASAAIPDTEHVVVEHAGHIVDWTARQYWPDAPHPLVEPVAEYEKRWRTHY